MGEWEPEFADIRDLRKEHIGQRATVTLPEAESIHSFAGVLHPLTHSEAPENCSEPVTSNGIFKVNDQMTSVGAMTESSAGHASITFLGD